MTSGQYLPSMWKAVFIVNLVMATCTHAQAGTSRSVNLSEYFSEIPAGLTLQEDEPQIYVVTSYFHNRDIYGKPTSKALITAEYTRALDDGLVRWNNVRIATWQDSTQSFSEGRLFECMENLTYRSPDDIANPDLYKDFPKDDTQHLLRMLIWDAIGIETYAWTWFDKLRPNKTVHASDFEDYIVQMADWGILRLKDLELKWAGISEMNDDICALIQYQSFCNPTESMSPAMTAKGRSLYWGAILVSLEDKQIEYGTLNEDIVMETITGNSGGRRMNMQREVVFEKRNGHDSGR